MKTLIKPVFFMGLCLLSLLPVAAASAQGRLMEGGAGAPGIIPISPTQVISIIGHHEGDKFVTGIEPWKEFRLDRFTRVEWTNNADVPVRIQIGSGPKCVEATDMIMRNLGSMFITAKCYVTKTPIPAGRLLETRFEEAGRFPYEIEYIGEKAKERGIISVY